MKTLLLLLITTIPGLYCFGKTHPALVQNTDTSGAEAIVRFEVKNSTATYVALEYSYNYIKGYNDTLMINNGICEKKYHLSKPVYMEVRVGGFYGKIYLAPHYQSKVTIDRNNRTNGIVNFECSGDGAIANNYLNAIKTVSIPPKFGEIGRNLTEEQYLEKLENHYTVLDSVCNSYLQTSASLLEKDSLMSSFFNTEKMDLRYHKAGRLLNFMIARKYKKSKAGDFFKRYVEPLELQKEEINLASTGSILFFNSYLLNYLIARQSESKDSTIYRKIGHYAYLLDYASKHYQGATRAYTIAENLHFLAAEVRKRPPHLPPVDSLIKVYDSYLTAEMRELIWKRYNTEMAPNNLIYAEQRVIENFKMVNAENQEFALKDKLTPVTVIDLWASWCGNCIEAFPYLEKLEQHFNQEKRVSFLRVSLDDKGDHWKRSVQKLKLEPTNTFWITGGMKSDFAKKFDITGLPRYIILNKEGKILKLYAPHIGDTQKFISLINNSLK